MLRRTIVFACFGILTISASTLLMGCNSGMKGAGTEADLVSENSSKKAALPKGTGPLWPLSPGKSWRTLTLRPNKKNVDSEIRVIGPKFCR
jgi:hypothetical protein